MSTSESLVKRSKTISRVVALSAMADDKSSVHEAAIAKARMEKLISKHSITEKELILAGWKPKKKSTTPPRNKATSTRSTGSKRSNTNSKQNQRSKSDQFHHQEDIYKRRQEERKRQQQAYERDKAERYWQQEYIEAVTILEGRVWRTKYFSQLLSRFILILATPSLLVLGFEFFLLMPMTSDATVISFISEKPAIRRHLGFVLVFAIAMAIQLRAFFMIKTWLLRRFKEEHGGTSKEGLW